MQLYLAAAFIPLVNILWCGVSADDCNISNLLLELGYSQECIVSSLASLLIKRQVPTTNECSLNEGFVISKQKNITNTMTEAKSERENDKTFPSEIKALLQEVVSEQVNERNNSDAFRVILANVTNSLTEIKAILQEVMSERGTIAASVSDFKQENVTKNSEKKIAVTVDDTKPNSKYLKPEKKLKNCAEFRATGETISGVRTLTLLDGNLNANQVTVYCDQVTDRGGWTVFQNRDVLPVRESFERSWQEYEEGFGDPEGEYWLGLDNLHFLTSSAPMELRVDIEDWEGEKRWVKYNSFHVGDAASGYALSIAGFSGDAGDPNLGLNYNNKDKFSTPDRDNDGSSDRHCGRELRGGWWFKLCTFTNLNGYQHEGDYEAQHNEGIFWYTFRGWKYSLKKVSMKTRPVSRGF